MALTLRSSCTAVVSLLLFANEGLSRHPLIEGMLSFKSADFSCGVSLVTFASSSIQASWFSHKSFPAVILRICINFFI